MESEKNHATEHGHHQSPIDIDLSRVSHDPSLKSVLFEHSPSDCLEVFNKGSTWSVRVCKEPQTKLTGSHLPGTYRLAELHAHWGEKSNDGSEHLVNGKGYAAEIHLVHYNEKHDLVESALKHGDGLAVLGIFLEEGQHDNPALEPLIQALQQIKFKGQTSKFLSGFDLSRLLPNNKNFVTYCGSLTTPPFTECVVWTVFVNPIPISSRQLAVFRSLCANEQHEHHEHHAQIVNNARSAQLLGKREVRSSFLPQSHS